MKNELEAFFARYVRLVKRKARRRAGRPLTYRARFKFRMGKRLNVDSKSWRASIEGRRLKLVADDGTTLIRDADSLVWLAGGFADAASARSFGKRLSRALAIAAIRRGMGADIGHDPVSNLQFGEAITAPAAARGINIISSTDGVSVYPDDGTTLIISSNINATVSTAPNLLIVEIRRFIDRAEQLEGVQLDAVILLNAALMSKEPLARLALTVSAVEMLAKPQKEWTSNQLQALARFEGIAEKLQGLELVEIDEIKNAVKNMRHFGANERCRRLIRSLGLDDLLPHWRHLYSLRSQIFHGVEYPTQGIVGTAAQLSVALASRIVLASVKQVLPGADAGIEMIYPIPQ